MWTKSIALIVLSLGGLTQFGMAKWKSVTPDVLTYMSAPALSPAPAPRSGISVEPQPTATASVAPTTAPTVSSFAVGSAPAPGASPSPVPNPAPAPAESQSAAGQPGTIRAQITTAVDESDVTPLKGNTHPLARAEFDQGIAPQNLPMNRMIMVLKRTAEQDAALSQLMEQQQDKTSPNYHQWLTPQQFGQQFGLADSDIQAVTSWLGSHGFTVSKVSNGRTFVEFSGTAAQVQEAFHTEIHKFVVNGNEQWANASDPQIPSALAPAVHGLLSLNNFPKKSMLKNNGEYMRAKATGEITKVTGPSNFSPAGASAKTEMSPEFTFNSTVGIGPSDFATIYNVQALWNAGIDGTGQTIAIVGDSNVNVADMNAFRSSFGLSVNPPTIILNGPDPGINNDETEADADLEWSGGIAKNATILFVVTETTNTTQGVDLGDLYIIDNNIAPVMSESFGNCEYFNGNGGNAFYNTVWQQAAAQGITAMISSGDALTVGCDQDIDNAGVFGLAVNGIASTPYTVSVGGTDFDDVGTASTYFNSTNTPTTQQSAKSYVPEVPWTGSCAQNGLNGCAGGVRARSADIVGGAGGPSNCATQTGNPTSTNACIGGVGVPKPSWQAGPGVPADGVRDQPDVSLFASNVLHGAGYVVCEGDAVSGGSCDLNSPFQHFILLGGTSLSSPSFAGIMALVNQKTGQRQGNANPVLYALAAVSGNSCNSSLPATITNTACIFYDVTKGNNAAACEPNFTAAFCSSKTNGVPGVTVDPNNQTTEAWTTTTGYDMATGLGTVNAANLVNNWASVSFKGSGTTLSLNGGTSAVSITHGASVTVAGAVTGTGTPTGQVSLLTNAASEGGVTDYSLSSGAYSGSTTALPGGTYTVHAHYPGDGTFGASDSPAINVTVAKENSGIGFFLGTFPAGGGVIYQGGSRSAVYGSPYVLRGDVVNSQNQFCENDALNTTAGVQCGTGTVTEKDGANLLDGGTFTLNSGGNYEDQSVQLAAGVHSLTVSYSGDNSYNPSTNTLTLTITKDPTTTTAASNQSSIAVGTSVTLTATVNTTSFATANASQEPTGTIQFQVNGTNFGSPVTVIGGATSQGEAFASGTLTTTTLPSGTDNVTAVYAGDSNYMTSTSSATVVTVTGSGTPGGPNVSLASSHTGNFTVGTNGVYNFTVTNNGAAPTVAGQLTITDTLPTGLTFVSGGGNLIVAPTPPVGTVRGARNAASPQVSSTGDWACSAAGQVVTCTFNPSPGFGGGTIAANGGTSNTAITVAVAQAAVPSVTNVSVVSEPGDAAPGSANKTASDPTTVVGAANPTPAITSLSPASAIVGGPAFTLTVNGTGFVSTSVVNFNNFAKVTTFVSATQLTASILATDIASTGTPPVTVTSPTPGGGTSNSVTFNVNNPAPTLSSIAPTSAILGSGAFTITVNGTGFIASSVVDFNGTARTTTFVSSTQLTAAILAGDVNTAGTFPITVVNPTPGGGTSAGVNFTVNNPAPVITSLSPTGVVSGSGALTLTVNGTGFIASSTVNFNGTARVTTFVSATQLTAAILASDVAAAGTPPITVVNLTPGGGTSNAINFNISAAPNPVPTITTISPTTALAGSAGFTLTVNGTNFVSTSVVNFNGSPRVTTFGSATQITAAITAADIASTGTPSITVFNPAPVGGTSNAATLTVNNPLPTLATLSPTGTTVSTGAFTLTVTGTGFVSNSVVNFNGAGRVTTFVSATQLTAAILASDITTVSTPPVTVTNPTPGGGTSNAINFNIAAAPNPVPTVTTLSPNNIVAGSAGFTLTVNGTNFVSTSTVNFGGAARATTFVSATQLTAVILAGDVATPGSTPGVTVTNPAPGGGTSNSVTFTVNNPFPNITSISPTTTSAGTGAFTLTVNGTNFVSNSVVQWQGSARATTFVSATKLTAAITAADVQTANDISVTVSNPLPGGGISNSQTFFVSTPVGVLTTLSPSSAFAGGAAFTLTVNGSNFLNTAIVQWNGGNRTTTFVSANQLTAAITAADIATVGSATVQVFIPTVEFGRASSLRPQGGPPGTLSNSLMFTINPPNPVPTLTAISPNLISAGGAGFTMTLTGTNFVSSSVAQVKGSARVTTFVSATSLTAAITAADIATGGTAAITVFTPTPGGGTTAAINLTITDFSVTPTPTTQTVAAGSPTTYTINTATVGGAFANSITFTASGFPTGAGATFSPTSVTPGSSSTMTVTTTARGLAETMRTPFNPGGPNRPLWLIAVVLALALTSLGFAKLGRRSIRRLIPIGAFALLLISAGYLSGCAGSGFPKVGSNLGTPAGTYTITVTGTSGADVHTTTVTLIVQ
jgi:Pro-kumamolisin, activation domain/Bacterial Ig-like domain (group 3)